MSKPIIVISPELQKASEDFNREMQEAAIRINAVCEPITAALAEGLRAAAESLRNPNV